MRASLRLLVLLAVLAIPMARFAGVPRRDSPAQSSVASGPLVGSIGNGPFAAAVPVRHAVYSPDGHWLAGTGRGEVRIWDAATGRTVRRIAFGDSSIGCLAAFTPNGEAVLVLAFEDVPYVSAPPYLGHNWPVTVRRFDAATGAEQGRVRLTGLNAMRLHGRPVAAFTPDGSGVMIGGDSHLPIRFDTATGREIWGAKLPPTNDSYAQHLSGIAASPDGTVIAAAVSNSGGPFLMLDAATGAVVGRPEEPDSTEGISVAFSKDGKWIATAGRGTTVAVWDAATLAPRARLTTSTLVNTPIALSPAGDRVAVTEYNAGIRVYDVATGRESARTVGRLEWPTVAFAPDGATVAAASGRVFVLDAAAGSGRGATVRSSELPPQFRFSADGSKVHVRTGPQSDLVTYELPARREIARTSNPAAASLGFSTSQRAITPDGRLMAEETVRGNEGAIVVTELATGRERCRIPFNPARSCPTPTGFSADGGLLYLVGAYAVTVWDTTTGKRVRALAEVTPLANKLSPYLSVQTSPNGRFLAVLADVELRPSSFCGTCDAMAPNVLAKTVTVWDTTSWCAVRTVPVPAGSWLRWQSDGRFAVETVARWPIDPRNRWTGVPFDGGGDPFDRLRYDPLPDLGPYIVEDWTVAEGRIQTSRLEPPPRERIVPAPDGRILAGFDPDNPARSGLRLYETETGRILREFSDDEPCRSAAFSPDGRYLLTDHPATGIRVWDVRRLTGRTPR